MSLDPLLLQMLGNKTKLSDSGALMSLLQSQDSLSPRAQAILQFMQQHEDVEDRDVINDEQDDIEQQLRLELQAVEAELDEAREMIDVLAEAIGACPDCFGGDDDCPECHGYGVAGWQLPNRKLFSHFIVPAVRRIKASTSRQGRISKAKLNTYCATTDPTSKNT